MHTRFSEDGEDTPETMCRRALELGVSEIGFSEHWDVGPYEQKPRFFQPEPWYTEIERLRGLFAVPGSRSPSRTCTRKKLLKCCAASRSIM